MKKRNEERGKAFLLMIALGMILFGLYSLYDVYMPYFSGDEKYGKLQELARESGRDTKQQREKVQSQRNSANHRLDQEGRERNSSSADVSTDIGAEIGIEAETGIETGIRNKPEINFKPLQDINSDLIAWITFEKPSEIDYPIVQGRDNQEYLTRTFDEDGHKYGTIFMDVDNSPDFADRNTFIYGHHMRNGSMFAGLLDYLDKAYYEAHPYFTIDTIDGRVLTYQVCSVEITAEGTLSYQWQYDTEEIWREYLAFIMNNSSYQTGVTLNGDSRLVSLSTCLNTTTSQRVLLHGVLVEKS